MGVDLSPQKKQCNFDCLYCELGGAKTIESMQEVLSKEEILHSIKEGLNQHKNIDVLTITATGEPTLHPDFLDLSKEIAASVQGRCKTLILSNGSRFGIENVREGLKYFDIVKFSLDCISPQCFRKLDRPSKNLKIEEILEGISIFAHSYQGELVCEVLVLENLNDKSEEMEKIASFCREIGVHRIDLGTLDRPPAYQINGVEIGVLQKLSEAFEGLCVSIPQRKKNDVLPKQKLKDEQELFEILIRRPLREDEIEFLFGEESLVLIERLLQKEVVVLKNVANMKFFAPKS